MVKMFLYVRRTTKVFLPWGVPTKIFNTRYFYTKYINKYFLIYGTVHVCMVMLSISNIPLGTSRNITSILDDIRIEPKCTHEIFKEFYN